MNPSELDALYAFLAAIAIAALLTPLTMLLARRVGAVDQPRQRGLSNRETPLLGGLAMFAAVAVAGEIWLRGARLPREPAAIRHLLGHHVVPTHFPWTGILAAGAVITLVGALDDRFDFHPAVKLGGQILAAIIAVHGGVNVPYITLPFFGPLAFPQAGPTLTVIGLVGMMNVVNFSDGADGLARRGLRDRRRGVRGDRLQPPPGRRRRARGDHGGGRARLPVPQLPAGVELHG